MKSLTIGRLARQAGLNLETVRFYERRGLLPRPPRSPSGYRLFPEETARRLKFIQRAQELGFSLAEITELLSLRVSRRTTSAAIRARAEAKIADIEAKMRSLESMKKTRGNSRKRATDAHRLPSVQFLRALIVRTRESHVEAKLAGVAGGGRLDAS